MRLIDADVLMPNAKYKGKYDTVNAYDIVNCPTVDAVPVVRCDDCIYRDGKTPGQPNILCWQMHSDDYCSYGTKREVGAYCEDIVSVVRCKDCECWVENEHCLAWAYEYSDANGYCYLGKRRNLIGTQMSLSENLSERREDAETN